MRAVRVHEYHSEPRIDDIPEPTLQGPLDVIVKVGGAGVCRTDLHIVNGDWAQAMQGFVQRRIPLFARRALTLAPALVVLSLGVDPTAALVFSQVVLAFGIPFALVPLVLLTRSRGLMGELVNRTRTTVAAGAAAVVIIALNAVLLWHTFT